MRLQYMAEEKEKLWGAFFFCHASIYRFSRAYITPEPSQISLAFVSLETSVAEEKKKIW